MTRLPAYLAYHRESRRIGDIDPAHAMLQYLVQRFELNPEQTLWLCFLYAMTYNGASVYYVYSEAPDYENVNIPRLDRWWYERGREETVFTTDRRWCRSRNQFVDAVASYQKWIGAGTQQEKFNRILTAQTPEGRYDQVYKEAASLYTMGRFSIFLYAEALAEVAGLDIIPTDLDLNQAWSCRGGLLHAYGLDEYQIDGEGPTPVEARPHVAAAWTDLRQQLPEESVFSLETELCAFRKFKDGKRVIGSYVDRQGLEIAKMRSHVEHGVDWRVLEQYRQESFPADHLVENVESWDRLAKKGLPQSWKDQRFLYTFELTEKAMA